MADMCRCDACGEWFSLDDADTVEEYHLEVHASEYFAVCPYCGCDELDICSRTAYEAMLEEEEE